MGGAARPPPHHLGLSERGGSTADRRPLLAQVMALVGSAGRRRGGRDKRHYKRSSATPSPLPLPPTVDRRRCGRRSAFRGDTARPPQPPHTTAPRCCGGGVTSEAGPPHSPRDSHPPRLRCSRLRTRVRTLAARVQMTTTTITRRDEGCSRAVLRPMLLLLRLQRRSGHVVPVWQPMKRWGRIQYEKRHLCSAAAPLCHPRPPRPRPPHHPKRPPLRLAPQAQSS